VNSRNDALDYLNPRWGRVWIFIVANELGKGYRRSMRKKAMAKYEEERVIGSVGTRP
jgi:hypothetical protein